MVPTPYLFRLLLALTAAWIPSLVFGQLANVNYSVQVDAVTSYENFAFGACWESGTEEYTAYIKFKDNINTSLTETGCLQCNNNGDCTYGGGTFIGTRNNTQAYTITGNIDAWEDDGGGRCSHNGGDDCRRNGDQGSYNFREWQLPGSSYIAGPTWGSTSDHQMRLDVYWNYSAGGASISPCYDISTVTANSGQIRSWEFTASTDRSYFFSTVGATTDDTYIRIYGTDGQTIVAFNDDAVPGSILQSEILFTPPTAGTYYIELSNWSRFPLTSTFDLTYFTLREGENIANPIDAGSLSCASTYTNTQSNVLANCFGNAGGGSSADDIWYEFSLANTAVIDYSTCSSGGTDTYVNIYDSGGTLVAQVDDNGPLCSGLQGSIQIELAPGTYYAASETYFTTSGSITTELSITTPSGGVIFGESAVCSGANGVSYWVEGVNGATGFNWNLPSGASISYGINTDSIVVDFGTSSGNVSVTPTNNNGTCTGATISFPVTVETPPSAAAINSVAYNCQGNQFALDGAAAAVGSTVWSLVSGPGTVGPGVGPTEGILNTVPLQSTVTVRYSVTTGTGICPDETEDRVINYMTDLAAAADGISTCAPIAGGGVQYFGTASGEKLYVGLNPNGNNLGIVDVELPAGNAFSTPALYWSGLDAPLGSYGGGATDPARMDGGDPSCPDELFVEDTWEIDVATQPTGTDPQVVVYLPRAKWDAFVTDGNTWLDATPGLRTNYLACYNTFPAPSDPPTTTNVTVTGYHADGRSVHPVGGVSYDATGDFYAITFNTDRFSGFALHGSGSGDPLPVTLVQFDGEHIQGDNHLEWITATEQNVSHFVVERSPDGMTYSDLATVEAAGNSTTAQTYSYVDANVPQGGHYYRLRTVDLDGTTDHSQAIWLGAEGGLWAGDFIQVLPNPTTAEAEVRFFLPQAGAYTMRISDAVGRLVEESSGQGQDGLNTVPVDVSQEAAGTYIVAIRRADGRWLKARLIKSTD